MKSKRTKSRGKAISRAEAYVLLIAGLVLGTIFLFGVRHWEGAVERSEATGVTATFSEYRHMERRRGGGDYVLHFTDHDPISIPRSCAGAAVNGWLEALTPGAELQLLVHPRSDTALEIAENDVVVLDFEEVTAKLAEKVREFTALGLFLYFCAAAGAVKLLRKKSAEGNRR